jgi:hypothetical protein
MNNGVAQLLKFRGRVYPGIIPGLLLKLEPYPGKLTPRVVGRFWPLSPELNSVLRVRAGEPFDFECLNEVPRSSPNVPVKACEGIGKRALVVFLF